MSTSSHEWHDAELPVVADDVRERAYAHRLLDVVDMQARRPDGALPQEVSEDAERPTPREWTHLISSQGNGFQVMHGAGDYVLHRAERITPDGRTVAARRIRLSVSSVDKTLMGWYVPDAQPELTASELLALSDEVAGAVIVSPERFAEAIGLYGGKPTGDAAALEVVRRLGQAAERQGVVHRDGGPARAFREAAHQKSRLRRMLTENLMLKAVGAVFGGLLLSSVMIDTPDKPVSQEVSASTDVGLRPVAPAEAAVTVDESEGRLSAIIAGRILLDGFRQSDRADGRSVIVVDRPEDKTNTGLRAKYRSPETGGTTTGHVNIDPETDTLTIGASNGDDGVEVTLRLDAANPTLQAAEQRDLTEAELLGALDPAVESSVDTAAHGYYLMKAADVTGGLYGQDGRTRLDGFDGNRIDRTAEEIRTDFAVTAHGLAKRS